MFPAFYTLLFIVIARHDTGLSVLHDRKRVVARDKMAS